MRLMQGAYSCISLVKDVGLVAFRDPFGIRCVSYVGLPASQAKSLSHPIKVSVSSCAAPSRQ